MVGPFIVFGCALLCVTVLGLARYRRVRSLKAQAVGLAYQPAPAIAIPPFEEDANISPGEIADIREATAMSAFAVPVTALWEIARIDPKVIDGISAASSHSSGIPAVQNSYTGFLRYVADHGGSLDLPGFTNRLAGYVGEQQAADALVAQGHVIDMAVSPTNPDWDFLLDGHMANVTTYRDAAYATQHAVNHPDVLFVLPTDAVHTPDLPNVAIVDGFSYADVHDALNTSLDAGVSLVTGDFLADSFTGGLPLTWSASRCIDRCALSDAGN